MQQRKAAFQAHHAAHGLLVRGRDKGQPELRAQAQGLVHPQTLGVHRHRHQVGAAGNQAVARTNGARVLKPHVLARVQQGRTNQMEGLLRAAHYEDLFGVAGDATVHAQV